ncbi:TRAP transporter small permease subunit [Noviherbaspirillum galbum]|uniref:TRAP transporter small permease protein n=1 Tax=Noviherbaspirillum galbum TaxID=2709383 RepID=A0A6B3SZP6_9BURK|nr:TRAP transporter small permease subunit [Noviherbaspirillum galbum]NEX64359.1 TRAP transporter small permease subunit [Noviherbaspirillum galbum]
MRESGLQRGRAILDRMMGRLLAAASLLVLPVSLLLFLQWPLRELVHAWSREANDLAQWLFAFYISAALTYATRVQSHPAAHAIAHRYPPALRRRLHKAASLLVLLPWSSFILYAATPAVWQSVLQLEGFPETYNPGYFLVKVAAWVLALLVLLQALLDLFAPAAPGEGVRDSGEGT